MLTEEIRESLLEMRDPAYRVFVTGLLPTVDPDTIIGIRTPALRDMAKALSGRPDIGAFLRDLPHRYFDENQLHAFILSGMKDCGACIREIDRFLPYIDNWATCDQLSPAVFRKNKAGLPAAVSGWIASNRTYTIRFGVGMLMQHFLDADFDPAFPGTVAGIRTEEYYVRMMIAWYFATALAKQYDAALPYIENRRLDPWTHNMAIQKAVESRRIPEERKAVLRGLRLKQVRLEADSRRRER